MLKKNKLTLIIASIITLLPAVAGVIFWDKLPDVFTTHWGADGVADGTSGKAFAVFGIPLIFLALFWVCVIFTAKDPGNKEQNGKVLGAVLWVVPFLSLFVNAIVYAGAMGMDLALPAIIFGMIGLMFMLFGNYMPKCRQNSTIGIKIPWTLASEENWNATHRLAGKVWFFCGLIMLVCIFLPFNIAIYIMFAAFLIAAFGPMLYSWAYYRKQAKAGTVPEKAKMPDTKANRVGKTVTAIFVPIILIGVGILMFTGNIDADFGEEAVTVSATYYGDAVVEYDSIDSVEYRTDLDGGMRVMGFGSARLSLGTFQCEELGNYTRYAYTGADDCVLLTSGDKYMVIALKNPEETKAFYDELMSRIG